MGKPGRSGAKRKYEWPEQVGQQRVMSGYPPNIRSAACMWAKHHGMRFATEVVESFIIVRRVS